MNTIIVIDDETMVRHALGALLRQGGLEVLEASDGHKGLDLIAESAPDLVLLDIMMPGINGYEVLARIKGEEKTRDLPVIVISAVDGVQGAIHCIEQGADDYLTKPFQRALLMARVNACLEKKRLRDQERRLHEELMAGYNALQVAEHTREALIQMIVHDLNNMLVGVMGYVEYARLLAGDPPINLKKLTETHREIYDAARDMSALIAGILEVSKLEAGQMPVSPATFNAVDCVREAFTRMRGQAEQKGIQFTVNTEEEDIPVVADYNLLSRVLQNLLSNAFKFIGQGTRMAIGISRTEAEARITVEDDGPGIPAAYHDRIFEKFFQLPDTSRGERSGVGLGLAFCKLAVEAQGGRIELESDAGAGTRFTVILPTAEI